MEVGLRLQRINDEDRGSRKTSPERGRGATIQGSPRLTKPPMKRVQVMYYLTRNGQLEHPHYLEVSHPANHHLRLKDVMERLTVLRGKAMPYRYSWSCKRSYRNGFVWNDLAENDVIHPAEGAEYVLKGSELIQAVHVSRNEERMEQLQLSGLLPPFPEPSFHSRRTKAPPLPLTTSCRLMKRGEEEREVEDDEREEDKVGDGNCTVLDRCSKGVSTDEITELRRADHDDHRKNPTDELTLVNHTSPPSASSTDGSKRFEDGEAAPDPAVPRRNNSVLLHLIACGSGGGSPVGGCKTKNRAPGQGRNVAVAREAGEMICMSLNPGLLGGVQSAEKEYFSGSMAESMMEDRSAAVEPQLQKSSSHKEQRSTTGGGLGVAAKDDEEEAPKRTVKARCIPRKKPTSSASASSSSKPRNSK